MKNNLIHSIIAAFGFLLMSFTPPAGKISSSKTQIRFFSSTPAEDIEASNYKAVSTLDTETGVVVFSVPMQSFEFEKALMQKHFNQPDFLDTKTHPKAKLTGKIENISTVDFSKPDTYPVTVTGQMEIKGKINDIVAKGNIIVSANGISAESKFSIVLADYGVTFQKGKPSTNIAKTVEVTVKAEYTNSNN